jgi:tetratricopeptide (TPR) repeat protein
VRCILFGDFKVDGVDSGPATPATFHVVLAGVGGQVFGRQPVSNNGRYRFTGVSNGEYDVIVELDGREVARIRTLIAERTNTDVRRDIQLEWKTARGAPPSTISAASLESYNRTPANQASFDKALEASRKKEYDKAISLLRQIVESEPADFVTWTELGTLYSKKDQGDDAESAYLRALGEKPTFLLALMNLSKLRLAERNFEGAIEILNRALAADPRSADANFLIGEAYLQIKKGSKAVGYLQEAIKLDPVGKAEAHLRLAALYNGAGVKDRAANEYEQFLSKKPDYPQRKELEKYIKENKK